MKLSSHFNRGNITGRRKEQFLQDLKEFPENMLIYAIRT